MEPASATAATNAVAQAIRFQRYIFKPSIMPKGIRLKAARKAFMKATIQKISSANVAIKTHPNEMKILVRGPANAVFPTVSLVADPAIITAPGEIILNGGGRKIEISVMSAPCIVNLNSAHKL